MFLNKIKKIQNIVIIINNDDDDNNKKIISIVNYYVNKILH